jgi:hypothetical protein
MTAEQRRLSSGLCGARPLHCVAGGKARLNANARKWPQKTRMGLGIPRRRGSPRSADGASTNACRSPAHLRFLRPFALSLACAAAATTAPAWRARTESRLTLHMNF